MTEKTIPEISFDTDDSDYVCPAVYIADDFVYELVEILFDIEAIIITNLSMLSDFVRIGEIPGHEYTRLIDIPVEDREKYYSDFKDRSLEGLKAQKVRYPPIPEEKLTQLDEKCRVDLIKLIESKFKISMKDYSDEDLYVWKVAHFVKYKLKVQTASMFCC
ncbi:MAG: hypothetical protein ACTSUW_03430 [Candidatus Heimdallarchaeota archaeon]